MAVSFNLERQATAFEGAMMATGLKNAFLVESRLNEDFMERSQSAVEGK